MLIGPDQCFVVTVLFSFHFSRVHWAFLNHSLLSGSVCNCVGIFRAQNAAHFARFQPAAGGACAHSFCVCALFNLVTHI